MEEKETKNHYQRLTFTSNNDKHWGEQIADYLIEKRPQDSYVLSAGISPSGVVHFGNFRDIMTCYAVAEALKKKGKEARIYFIWDDFDRFRKVPAGVDASYSQYIGKPLTSIPDPLGEYPSYARRFEAELEDSVSAMGMDLDFFYQTQRYQEGDYDDLVILSMQKREEVAKALLYFMPDKSKNEKGLDEKEYIDTYYPLSVYSRLTGKDKTKIVAYDGDEGLTYKDLETGEEDKISLRKDHVFKLAWKVDWPMRWTKYNVAFEPGGLDHATPGGSYDVSRIVCEKVFGHKAPVFVGYQFIGIRGIQGKMSGSKGNAIAPAQLLEIYEPSLLKWVYLRRNPGDVFDLAFDSEIFRQYDEFDREVAAYKAGELTASRKLALEIAMEGTGHDLSETPVSIRQLVGFGQIAQWNADKLADIFRKTGVEFSESSLRSRLKKAETWVKVYNPDQAINLLDNRNDGYIEAMDEEAKLLVRKLRESLQGAELSIEDLNALVYGIPKDESLQQKENAVRQRAFFKDVYSLLIGKDTGPRLATFLWAADKERVLSLLDF